MDKMALPDRFDIAADIMAGLFCGQSYWRFTRIYTAGWQVVVWPFDRGQKRIDGSRLTKIMVYPTDAVLSEDK